MKNNITFLVFKKELIDTFRDKKTIFVSILIPLIIYPLLFGVMGRSVDKTQKAVENNLKIAIVDKGNSGLGKFIKSQKNINIIESSNPDEDVKSGKVYIALEIPENFDSDISSDNSSKVNIIYDNSSQQSVGAFGIFKSYIDEYSKQVVAERLKKRSIDTSILSPIETVISTPEKEDQGMAKQLLSLLLPLLLIIGSVTGPMGAAVDFGAGEKERGTLEPLLTTKAGRMSLLWGKFFAITVIGLLSTIASLTGLFISMKQNNGLFQANASGGLGLTTASILLIGLIAMLITMVFGALELSISIYARSFKEAQTYITPLTIISFVPAYATYMMDAKNIDPIYFHIPLANAACLIKEFIAGIFNFSHILITFVWIAIYILVSILLARYMFSREEVIFRT